MKRTLKNNSKIATAIIALTMFASSCIKDRNAGAVDFTKLTPIVQIYEGGLTNKNFSSAAILIDATAPSDSIFFRLNYAATTVAPSDVNITLAIDDAALAAYNTDHPAAQYVKMPDSIFKFTQTQVVVKAGQSYSDAIRFLVYSNKVDQSVSYMLPISIKSASGINISGNFGTIYYHIIGNPQVGTYTNTGIRYNYNGFITVPYTYPVIPGGYTSTLILPNPKSASPVDATTVQFDLANLGPNGYYYFATVPPGLTGNTNFPIPLDFSQAFKDGDSQIDVKLSTYNPATKTFHFNIAYNNNGTNTGNFRIVDEVLVKQ